MHYMSLTLAYIFCYPLTFPIQPAVQLYIEGALVWLCKMNKSAATSCWDEGWVIRCVMKTISVRPLVHLSEGSVVCRLRVKIPAPFKKTLIFQLHSNPLIPLFSSRLAYLSEPTFCFKFSFVLVLCA